MYMRRKIVSRSGLGVVLGVAFDPRMLAKLVWLWQWRWWWWWWWFLVLFEQRQNQAACHQPCLFCGCFSCGEWDGEDGMVRISMWRREGGRQMWSAPHPLVV